MLLGTGHNNQKILDSWIEDVPSRFGGPPIFRCFDGSGCPYVCAVGGSFLNLCCVILQVLCHPPGFDFCPDDENSQEEIKSAKGKEYLLSEYIYCMPIQSS